MIAPVRAPVVTPRHEGDPVVDLTMFTIVHRSQRADVQALAGLLTDLAAASPVPAGQAVAIRTYIERFTQELWSHHEEEDSILWPVVSASAGAAIDLAPLTEDHGELAALVHQVKSAARTFADHPDDGAAPLARLLQRLAALVHAHLDEEEARLFPVMRQYVSVADWEECERQCRRSAGPRRLGFVLPWLADHATRQELGAMFGGGAWPFRVILALARPSYRRLKRRAFQAH